MKANASSSSSSSSSKHLRCMEREMDSIKMPRSRQNSGQAGGLAGAEVAKDEQVHYPDQTGTGERSRNENRRLNKASMNPTN